MRAIDEENIRTSIMVVIEQGDSAAHRFDQVLVGGRRSLVLEIDFARRRDAGERYVPQRHGRRATRSREETTPRPQPGRPKDFTVAAQTVPFAEFHLRIEPQ